MSTNYSERVLDAAKIFADGGTVTTTATELAKLIKDEIGDAYKHKKAIYAVLTKNFENEGRGVFNLLNPPKSGPKKKAVRKAAPVAAPAMVASSPNLEVRPVVESISAENANYNESLIPEKNPLYVPFGNFKDVKTIIKSGKFFPIYITGLSGNGKTFSVEQASAQLNREVVRINFTVETDEDDLIGGFRLINGDTKFMEGPIITAMKRGAVCLADEIDLADPTKIMCLQSILEGNGYLIKKTGEFVKPSPGFTIIATGNTKGRGSDDGKFIGTNIMNEAFLERFTNTYEQEYPPVATEKRILGKVFESNEIDDGEFVSKLVDWADIIRKTYDDGGVDEIISTRRLVHIANTYAIFDDRLDAVKKCINRFDDDTKAAFLDLYTKVDEDVNKEEESAETPDFV